MLEALDTLVPGVNSGNTLLYGVEVKLYSSRLKLSDGFETEVENLYAIGDGVASQGAGLVFLFRHSGGKVDTEREGSEG